jgi:hypothetical protein
MENVLINKLELASELAELSINQKYSNHYESIYDDCENGDTRYKDYIQDEFNQMYDECLELIDSLTIKQ